MPKFAAVRAGRAGFQSEKIMPEVNFSGFPQRALPVGFSYTYVLYTQAQVT